MTPPNEQLQLAVARAEGWTDCAVNKDEIYCDDAMEPATIFAFTPRGNYQGLRQVIPDYLNDANAAHSLIERLKGEGWRCSLNSGFDGTWECEFERLAQGPGKHVVYQPEGPPLEVHYAPAGTFCIAISKAYLAVRGVRVEEVIL